MKIAQTARSLAAATLLLGSLVLVLALRGLGYLERAFDPERLTLAPAALQPATLKAAATLRAFYSGHSLSEGVPEEVFAIAASRGEAFDYEFQSLMGSLIRQRTKGADPDAPGWPGLSAGLNRNGSGLDVAAELRRHFPDPNPLYDTLVVTERHDMPYPLYKEHTVRYLRVLHDHLMAGNPNARTFLYHTWLDIDLDAPEVFVAYERQALPLWECVASSANRGLAVDGRLERITVLPGATAMADLVERLARGDVAGAPGVTARERVQGLFSDHVHLSPLGRYFVGLVHYATLFGKSPESSAPPVGVSPQFATELQRIAWEHVSAYAPRAAAAAARDADVCADYVTQVMCPALAERAFGDATLKSFFSREKQIWLCRRGMSATGDANPLP